MVIVNAQTTPPHQHPSPSSALYLCPISLCWWLYSLILLADCLVGWPAGWLEGWLVISKRRTAGGRDV